MGEHQACELRETSSSVLFHLGFPVISFSLYAYVCRLQRVLFNLTQSLMVDEPVPPILKETFAISIEMRQPNSLGNISSLDLDPTFPMASASFPPDLVLDDVGAENVMTSVAAFADDALFLPRDPGLRSVATSVVDFTIGEISTLQSPVNLSFARNDVSLCVLHIVL